VVILKVRKRLLLNFRTIFVQNGPEETNVI